MQRKVIVGEPKHDRDCLCSFRLHRNGLNVDFLDWDLLLARIIAQVFKSATSDIQKLDATLNFDSNNCP